MEKSGSGIKKMVDSYENFKEPKIEGKEPRTICWTKNQRLSYVLK